MAIDSRTGGLYASRLMEAATSVLILRTNCYLVRLSARTDSVPMTRLISQRREHQKIVDLTTPSSRKLAGLAPGRRHRHLRFDRIR
jgi:hypothetical protein